MATCGLCGSEVILTGFGDRKDIPDEVHKRVHEAGRAAYWAANRNQSHRQRYDPTYETKEAARQINKEEFEAAQEQIFKELVGYCVNCYVQLKAWRRPGWS